MKIVDRNSLIPGDTPSAIQSIWGWILPSTTNYPTIKGGEPVESLAEILLNIMRRQQNFEFEIVFILI
jgi:hypothetical protein